MSRKTFQAEGSVSVGPYSHAVAAGNLVYFSGQTPIDPQTGKLVEGGIEEQTTRCLLNLFAVLKAAGLQTSAIVKVNVFLTDMNTFDRMNKVYAKLLDAPYPARTTIGVAALPLQASVEIELIAWGNNI